MPQFKNFLRWQRHGAGQDTDFVQEIVNNNFFVTELAVNNTFVTELVENNTFITELTQNETFITEITEHSTFVTNVTNIIEAKKGVINELATLDGEGKVTASQLQPAMINFAIDGGAQAITTGLKGFAVVPFDCTIDRVDIIADQTGSIVVDVWRDTYANHPPTDADSITSATPPTLSNAIKATNTTLTGWTRQLTEGDILAFNVDSAATVTSVTVAIKVSHR